MGTEELVLIGQVPTITQSLPEIITLNQVSLEKAKQAGTAIYEKVDKEGMSDELDNEINNFLVKLKTTVKTMNERRSPITKFFDSLKSQFTAIEGDIDQKSEFYTRGQKYRDAWAEKKRKDELEKEQARQLKINQEQEKIDVKAKIEIALKKYFLNILESVLIGLNNLFESATLENISEIEIQLKKTNLDFDNKYFYGYQEIPQVQYITDKDAFDILDIVKTQDLLSEHKKEYFETLEYHISSLIEKIPGKKLELEKIAKAGKEEKERLEKEAEDRRKSDEEKLKSQSDNKLTESALKAGEQANVAKANALFDINASQEPAEKIAQGIESYEISITNVAVIPHLFAFWWEREGRYKPLADLEKKSIKQMIAFVEKWAKSNGEKVFSEFIEYKPVYKTVAKSTK